jgi:hypothetical protein
MSDEKSMGQNDEGLRGGRERHAISTALWKHLGSAIVVVFSESRARLSARRYNSRTACAAPR